MADVTREPVLVATPLGDARVHRFAAQGVRLATLVLGHGAGRGTDTADLQTLARRLPRARFDVLLVDQPWVVAGRRVAPAAARLDEAWLAVLTSLALTAPVILGGRSAGARVACRTAGSGRADAVLALAFPLHPPGRPDRSRVAELLGCPVPVLVLQGGRDAFGRAGEFPPDRADLRVIEVPAADHSLYRGPVDQVNDPGWEGALDTAVTWLTERGESSRATRR